MRRRLVGSMEAADVEAARHDLVSGNLTPDAHSKTFLNHAILVHPLFQHLDSASAVPADFNKLKLRVSLKSDGPASDRFGRWQPVCKTRLCLNAVPLQSISYKRADNLS